METENNKIQSKLSRNKIIPEKYKHEIFIALSHFPELRYTNIRFQLVNKARAAYYTRPELASCFKRKENRVYIISILEQAKEPMNAALLKNLSSEMRIGVIAHELSHVVQFKKKNSLSLLKTLILYSLPAYQKRIERDADKTAISHGCGRELLMHALYIRRIPDYVKKHPSLDKNYLDPSEIRNYLSHPELISSS